MRGHEHVAEPRPVGERAVERFDRVAEQPAGDAAEDQQQPDQHDHRGQHRRIGERAQHDALDRHAADERHDDGQRERKPMGAPASIIAQAI